MSKRPRKPKLERKLDFLEQEALRGIPPCVYGRIQKIKESADYIRERLRNYGKK